MPWSYLLVAVFGRLWSVFSQSRTIFGSDKTVIERFSGLTGSWTFIYDGILLMSDDIQLVPLNHFDEHESPTSSEELARMDSQRMSMGLEPMELEPEPMDPRTEFFRKVGTENRTKNRKISNSRTGTETGGSGSGSVLLGSGPVLGSDPVLSLIPSLAVFLK
ncbi:hypothetical protein Tco_0854950 [Tanacetum coccineum]